VNCELNNKLPVTGGFIDRTHFAQHEFEPYPFKKLPSMTVTRFVRSSGFSRGFSVLGPFPRIVNLTFESPSDVSLESTSDMPTSRFVFLSIPAVAYFLFLIGS